MQSWAHTHTRMHTHTHIHHPFHPHMHLGSWYIAIPASQSSVITLSCSGHYTIGLGFGLRALPSHCLVIAFSSRQPLPCPNLRPIPASPCLSRALVLQTPDCRPFTTCGWRAWRQLYISRLKRPPGPNLSQNAKCPGRAKKNFGITFDFSLWTKCFCARAVGIVTVTNNHGPLHAWKAVRESPAARLFTPWRLAWCAGITMLTESIILSAKCFVTLC